MGMALVLAQCVHFASAAPTAPNDAVRQVLLWVEAKNCPNAVRALNSGLANGYPEVSLLAGAMYEEGICLKPDWNRAVDFYIKAHEGGQRDAAYRLASGYAAAVGGNDTAAALWWARQRGLVAACSIPEAGKDPDRFVEALQAWPKSLREACNYMVGVMATLAGDIQYPELARTYALNGSVHVSFLPSIPRLDVKGSGTEAIQVSGLVDGDLLRDRTVKSATNLFETAMRKVAERALKRYPQPAGIDPGWKTELDVRFWLE
jgi:hypothetical protein